METLFSGFKSLKAKITVIFGFFSVIAVIISSYVTYLAAVSEFNKELKISLNAIGSFLLGTIDPVKLDGIHSIKDPYYKEMKSLFRSLTTNFNLSWLAVYRYNGKYFTHIVDGADFGDEFIVDYPIFSTTPEMLDVYNSGIATSTDSYVDTYGTWMSCFIPVKLPNGKVIAIIDSSKNVEMLNRLKDETFAKGLHVVIFITIFCLILCWLFSHSLSKPLMRLTEGANLIAAGNLEAQIAGIESNDEIGILVRTFNTMTSELLRSKKSLERKIFELTLLFEISQKINFANNTQEILKMILEKTFEALKADRGSVMLYDEDSGTLVVEVVSVPGVNKIERRVRLRPGEGVAGKVFQDAMPLIINENIQEIFKPFEIPVETEVKNIMCIPLILEKKAIGVINIVNKKVGNFSENDLELASTLASQIALTIEKSRLYELSITDGLTKLFVHRYFQIALENEIKRAKRYGKSVSLILFDIDHFKKFNDTYGHQMGDIVLSYTALLIKETIRSIDIPARYGGEEFTIILPETDTNAAFEVAERVRKRVEAYDYPGQEKPVKVTISLGIASFPKHSQERLDLIKKADQALYASKKGGRNRATVFSEEMTANPLKHDDH